MSNPTTPFSWQMPTATDLVTDLPADFEVFGQAVATSMADLLGGTTGQVLAKNSNTDMDFVWVAQDDSNAIQNTIVDAKGDLIAASAADTPARLAVGANGETLVADSSTSTGLRYQTGVNNNGIINGGMDIWQRGTSFAIPSSTYTYTADRWIGLRFSTGATVSRQTASLDGFQYSARVARDSGNTGTGIIYLGYNLETADSYKYAGKTVTLSFWAKAGANFSSASSALAVIWASGTGTNQKQMDGFTGASTLVSSSVTLTTSWQRFSFTAAVPSNSTQQGFQFNYTPVGTAGAADNFEIVGVQQEFGSVATNFKRAGGGTIQEETSACQRYYVRLGANNGGTTGAYSTYGNGYSTTSTDASINITLPTTMRIPPTVCEFSNVAIQDFNTAVIAVSNVTMNSAFVSTTVAVVAATTVGATQFRGCKLSNNNNTAGYVGFSAEL
jgi:hypothetical protein